MRGVQVRADAPSWAAIRAQTRTGGSCGSEVEFRGLAANLLATQEEERRRVSRELHDELGQRLAVLEIQIEEMVRRLGAASPVVRELEKLRSRVADIAEDVHRICCRLHPAILENLGLVVALRSYCEEYSVWSGVKTRFTHCGMPAHLPANMALCLYRVVQESLRNVAKHSNSKRAIVILRGSGEGVHLVIRDSGQGFIVSEAPRKGGLGLISLSERVRLSGGICNIRSAPARGTRIQVWVPLTTEASAS